MCSKIIAFTIALFHLFGTISSNSCPLVSCGNLSNNLCGVYNSTSNNFTGMLCNISQYCPLGGYQNLSAFNNASCSSNKFAGQIRYIGESCNNTYTCKFGNCTNGECSSPNFNGTCSGNEECRVGTYCSNKTCTNQSANGNCSSDYACINTQGCYNGKCTNFFSLNLSSSVDFNYTLNPEKLCMSGLINRTNGLCIGNVIQQDSNGTNLTGLVSCNASANDACYYRDNLNNIQKMNCPCSLNGYGNSYCPLPYNETDQLWIQLATSKLNRLNNTCHTNNRFNCKSSTVDKNFLNLTRHTEQKHLYANSTDCIIDLFSIDPNYYNTNSCEFIKISFAFLAALIISLF